MMPERAIDSGLIGRFGNIDPALGGRTTRIGLTGNAHLGATDINLYGLYYRFLLTSNFTYFLNDPVNGDEFQQRDQRGQFGGSIHHGIPTTIGTMPVTFAVGGEGRWDHIGKIGLYHSIAGRTSGTVRQDKVDEYSGALYAEGTASLTYRLRLTLGLRGDLYGYDVRAQTWRRTAATVLTWPSHERRQRRWCSPALSPARDAEPHRRGDGAR